MGERVGENTRAVHLPAPPIVPQVPLGLPVYRTASFAFTSAGQYADVMAGVEPGYSYGRVDNPTADAFAQSVAALEGGQAGQGFASGMAAITAVFMAFTGAGSHVVAPREAYGGTYGLLTAVLARFGVETDFVDMADLAAVRAAMRPTTRIVWAETLANPTMSVADLPGLAAIAHEARCAARRRLDLRVAGGVPAAGARGRPGGALGDEVHRRSLRLHRRRCRRLG